MIIYKATANHALVTQSMSLLYQPRQSPALTRAQPAATGTYDVLPNEAVAVGGRGPAAHDHSFHFPVERQLEALRGVWHWKRGNSGLKSICILINWRNFPELKNSDEKESRAGSGTYPLESAVS